MTISNLRDKALKYLSRREHTRLELQNKLQRKFPDFPDNNAINILLDQLITEGWLSDVRFTTMYIRSRAARGFGPLRIRQGLLQRGITKELIETAFYELSDIDWQELAEKVCRKKFGANPPQTLIDQVKQKRFLYYRGFEEL